MALTLLHQETFRIRLFEADPTGRATAASLCRLAQEAAEGHCRSFGMTLAQVRAQNRMWVLTRFQLKMDHYPNMGDAVTVETWASSRTNGIRAVREFHFLNAAGTTLGCAKSVWLLLDATTKRPVRLPQIIADIRNAERSDPDEFEFPRLQPPSHPSHCKTFEVGWKELDANNHANNVNYVEWALEALPVHVRRDRLLTQLDIEFLAEAFHGDRVISEAELSESGSVHQLKNSAGKLLSLVTTRNQIVKE